MPAWKVKLGGYKHENKFGASRMSHISFGINNGFNSFLIQIDGEGLICK